MPSNPKKLNVRMEDGAHVSFYLETSDHDQLTKLRDHYAADTSVIVRRLFLEGSDQIDRDFRDEGSRQPDGSSKDVNLVAVHFGGNASKALRWLLKEAVDTLNASLMTGDGDPKELISKLPPSQAAMRDRSAGKIAVVTRLMESGGFNPPRFWPVNLYVPYENWEPGRSYWQKNAAGAIEYVWSGNFDALERGIMVYNLLGPYGGFPGLGNTCWFPSEEAYQARRDEIQPLAELIADAWICGLRYVQEADARGERLYPLGDAPTLVGEAAAWLQYVRHNPDISADRYQEVIKAVGLTEETHLAIRNMLTFDLTQRRGVLVGDYPWYGM